MTCKHFAEYGSSLALSGGGCILCWRERAEKAEALTASRQKQVELLLEARDIEKAAKEKAEAAAAERRWLCVTLKALVPEKPKAITWERGVEILNHVQDNLDKINRGASADCGQGWLSPEVVAKWEKEREHCRQQAENWEKHADKLKAQVKALVEALKRVPTFIGYNEWCPADIRKQVEEVLALVESKKP